VRAFAHGLLDREGGSRQPAATPLRIDVNLAAPAELVAVPGIGPSHAEAIVLHRVRHGLFRTVDDLAAVDGIGPGLLAALRPFVCVRPPAEPVAVPARER
jgi:competence protein ComEA